MGNWNCESAAVIGTGMMGPGIALNLAMGGVRATILSRTEASAQEGLAKARHQLGVLVEYGLVDEARLGAAEPLLAASADFDATVAPVDLVIESAPENMEFKQELFARLDSLTRPDAVLATNTSSLSISAIASRCRHPERVMTTHFWNPPYLIPLVEIVKGEKTDHALASAVKDLLTRCGKVAVMVKRDTPGQLGNRLQMALWREAVHIVESGIADVEDVDLAVRCGFGLRLPAYGMFEHMDLVGLDLASGTLEYTSQDLYSEPRAPQLMRDKMAAGETGARAGRGFYDWSKKDPEAVKSRRDRFVLSFLQSNKPGG
jgi:3-hydroxybutyryl-CoA dehydrogenase